jgi:DNA-binding transcriptional LysR family regulator
LSSQPEAELALESRDVLYVKVYNHGMHTDHLRLFLIIARHRSLSRAAVELDLGQATVSDRLRALEAEMGTALFERQGRGVTLTPAGEAFVGYAERALEVLRQGAESARAASAGQRGQVTVAVTVTSGAYLFAPALVAFQRDQPGVEVRVRSVHSWDAPGVILDGVAHLALISGPTPHPQIERVAGFRARLVMVCGRQNALVAEAAGGVELARLAQGQLLVSYWGPASQAFLERVRATAEGQGGESRPWMELSPVELVKGMLLAGTGASLVPEIAVQRELAAGELVTLPLLENGQPVRLPAWEITLIRNKRRAPNPAAEALAETLKKVLPGLAANEG